jgi:hypothetical protein
MEKARSSETASIKKVYTSPKLEIYGDLRSITEHVTNNPNHAGDGPPHISGNFRT